MKLPMKSPQEMIRRLVEASFTQAQIHEITGIPQPTLSRILTGTHNDPRHSTVEKLRLFYEEKIYLQSEDASSSEVVLPPSAAIDSNQPPTARSNKTKPPEPA